MLGDMPNHFSPRRSAIGAGPIGRCRCPSVHERSGLCVQQDPQYCGEYGLCLPVQQCAPSLSHRMNSSGKVKDETNSWEPQWFPNPTIPTVVRDKSLHWSGSTSQHWHAHNNQNLMPIRGQILMHSRWNWRVVCARTLALEEHLRATSTL